jgi:FkbM family methyltransferase
MAIGDVRQKSFLSRGATHNFRFKTAADQAGTEELHASWFSFDDEQIVRDRHWHIAPGETVLDVGAAFGSYALPALAMGGRVVAFSPADYDTRLLADNLDLNPDLARRCLVVRDGLHERDGWFDPDHSIFVVERPIDTDQHETGQWLRVRSLDSFLAERPGIDRVDWIKLDVEGAELGVLRGATATLHKYRPKLLIECHNFHVPDMWPRICEFLSQQGLPYVGENHPHCAVSHAFLEVK